jgi:hypothetical protein
MIIFIYKTKFFSNILNGIDQHLNEQQKHKKDIKEASEQQKSDNENISSTIDHQKVEVVSEKENDKHKRRKYHVEE